MGAIQLWSALSTGGGGGQFTDSGNLVVIGNNSTNHFIFDENGQIAKEEDVFYSGKSFYFTADQVNLPQNVVFVYDYRSGSTNDAWTIFASLDNEHFVDTLALAEADALLLSWGLSRK